MQGLDSRLTGTNMMLVDPNTFTIAYVSSLLTARGARLLGPVATIDGALALLRLGIRVHAAAIAMELADGPAWPVADVLTKSDIPFLFITGREFLRAPPPYAGTLVVSQPFTAHDIANELAVLRVGKASVSIIKAYDERCRSVPVGQTPGGQRRGLEAATAAYLDAYGRPPVAGEVEDICNVQSYRADLVRGH